ncbi:MAG TPA: ATP-binding cassette domain-containing protein [Bryobacteraceae bacterium]|jgi:sodium transport system ATP-binding protein|nr:ATP-binding cassette domain-containing protein [Bryobacteraceae bacterium]
MIQVQSLAKSFGAVSALRNVSFTASDGLIMGLLGANGAGKTTLLRIVSGLLRPDRGSIQIDGRDQHALDARTSLGSLLDHAGLYARLTARENLTYFGELHGLPHLPLERRADELLELLAMQSIADRPVSGFSLGQRTKVALARAMMHSPRNLLLDEPTNGLDVPTVRTLRAALRRMRDSGCCIIFSSHVLDEVREICDTVHILARGQIVAQGSPDDVCRQARVESLEDAFMELTAEERQ